MGCGSFATLAEEAMSVRLGRVFGIPVEIHATWIIIFALLTYSIGLGFIARVQNDLTTEQAVGYGAIAALALFICLMAHELAHALVARKCGIRTGVITLFLFGGQAQLSREPDEWSHELAIAIAGPASSILLALVFVIPYTLLPRESIWCTVAFYLAFANALLGAVNLLPGYPLDGGRVLRAILWGISRRRMLATRVATIAGELIGLATVGYGLLQLIHKDTGGIWLVMIGWYVSDCAYRSWEQERVRHSLQGLVAAEIVTQKPAPLSPTDTVSKAVENAESTGTKAPLVPVIDETGPVGIITSHQAASVPKAKREETRVADVMEPVDPGIMANPEENAWSIVERLGDMRDDDAIVVAEGTNVIGIVQKRELPTLLNSMLHAMAQG